MIDRFEVDGFKCFTKHCLDMSALTVLCGMNGSGKSSFIQALLLAEMASSGQEHVQLNGPFDLRLGQALDVLRSSELRLAAESRGRRNAWVLAADADDALTLNVRSAPSIQERLIQPGSGFIYLQAERLGPRDLQEMASEPSDQIRIGSRGEFVAQVLNLRAGRYPVRDDLCHEGAGGSPAARTLPKQTEAWLQELIPGIELRVEPFPSLNAAAIRLRRLGQGTEWLRPQNIGFGVSYVIPVIIAGLVAAPGSLIVIENPEAHLHPQAQSVLARFLARVANAGVQVLVETHSDHFLNGLRLAVVAKESIQAEQAAVQFFSCTESGVAVERIQITGRGSLSSAPQGFFDQSEKDLAAILKVRRRD